jgi:hypothetical protein
VAGGATVQHLCRGLHAVEVEGEGARNRQEDRGGGCGEQEAATVGTRIVSREGAFLLMDVRERSAIKIQLVSDLCDLTIPMSVLGYANFDDGFVGLAGMVSSLIGLHAAWKKTA